MEIKYRDIILRDMIESDIDDMIHYMTVDTQWGDWDAPWEPIGDFDADAYRKTQTERLGNRNTGHRYSLHIQTAGGCHIGKVSSYHLNQNYDWVDDEQDEVFRALGISILNSSYWGKGIGTQALTAWIRYHLDGGFRKLCLQTWSGNERMIRSAIRVGFVECRRLPDIRQVRGETYDALTFMLDLDRFNNYLMQNP